MSRLYGSLGFVAGTSILTRMHLYLILEIALLHGRSIDDPERVPEMVTVVTSGAAALAAPAVLRAMGLHPVAAMVGGGLIATSLTRLIGEAAIRFYAAPEEMKVAASAVPIHP